MDRIKYDVIVADPPWTFTTYSDKAQKSAQSHYSLMSVDDIAAIPVEKVADDNCLLLLWATWPNLIDAITVGQAWGFTYKTLGFDWVKQTTTGKALHMGLGYYTRSNTEPCLLFVRGNVKRVNAGVHQVILETSQMILPGFEEVLRSSVMAHSTKPEEFYRRTRKLMGDSKRYLELFSRTPRKGWTVLGDAINGMPIDTHLNLLAAMRRQQ